MFEVPFFIFGVFDSACRIKPMASITFVTDIHQHEPDILGDAGSGWDLVISVGQTDITPL